MVKKIRELSDVCLESQNGFEIQLHNILYCGVKPAEPDVTCVYRLSDKDHNKMYRCVCPFKIFYLKHIKKISLGGNKIW